MASYYDPRFNPHAFGADGVLGLSFKGVSSYNAPSVFEMLVDQDLLPDPVVGSVLDDVNGELVVGAVAS